MRDKKTGNRETKVQRQRDSQIGSKKKGRLTTGKVRDRKKA